MSRAAATRTIMGMIEQQVRWLVAEELELSPEAVQPQSHFVEDLGADSADVLWLLIALEERFTVEFPAAQLDRLTTAAAVTDLIIDLLQGTPPQAPARDLSKPAEAAPAASPAGVRYRPG
jgi:acyl carrier protein